MKTTIKLALWTFGMLIVNNVVYFVKLFYETKKRKREILQAYDDAVKERREAGLDPELKSEGSFPLIGLNEFSNGHKHFKTVQKTVAKTA